MQKKKLYFFKRSVNINFTIIFCFDLHTLFSGELFRKVKVAHMKAKKTIRAMLLIEIPKIAISGIMFKFYEFDPSPLPVLASILDSENSSASLSPPPLF